MTWAPARLGRPDLIPHADRVRSACVAASAAAMVLCPTLGPLLAGTDEGAEAYDTEITPPGYAFAIWVPIFGGVAANAVQHAIQPAAPVNRRTGWWLVGCYTTNAAWSVAAQANHFRYTAVLLPVAAGLASVAHRRAEGGRPVDRAGLITSHSSGLLFGWTSVASVVNVFAVVRSGRSAGTTRGERVAARLAVAAAAASLTQFLRTSGRDRASVALGSIWALATNAADSRRAIGTRLVTAAGAVTLAAGARWACRSR